MENIKHTNNLKEGIFEILINDKIAGELTYNWVDEHTLLIDHTEVIEGNEGKGLGGKLVKAAADYAMKNNKKVIAACSYAKSFLNKDPKLKHLLTE